MPRYLLLLWHLVQQPEACFRYFSNWRAIKITNRTAYHLSSLLQIPSSSLLHSGHTCLMQRLQAAHNFRMTNYEDKLPHVTSVVDFFLPCDMLPCISFSFEEECLPKGRRKCAEQTYFVYVPGCLLFIFLPSKRCQRSACCFCTSWREYT